MARRRAQSAPKPTVLDSKFIQCRVRRNHDWVPEDVVVQRTVYIQILKCTHGCDTQRVEYISRKTGEYLKHARYKYEPGYHLAKGAFSPEYRNTLRLNMVEEFVNKKKRKRKTS